MSFQLPLFQPSRSSSLSMQSTYYQNSLSIEQDSEFKTMVEGVIRQSFGELIQSRVRIENSLEEFRIKSSEANARFDTYVSQIAEDLLAGKVVDSARVKNARFIQKMTKDIKDRYFETSKQLQELEEMNRNGKFGDYTGAIDLIFKMRISQLDLVRSKIEILQTQENHELKILITLHNQRLRDQAQKIDYMLRVAKFNAEEKERAFRRRFDLEAQKLKEQTELNELAEERESIKADFREIERKYQKEIEDIKRQMRRYL